MSDPTPDPIEAMNALHVQIGQRAAELALEVLDAASAADIPITAAVSLLKFGVELQRKALLGSEEPGGGIDPFEALAQALKTPASEAPKEG